MTEPTADPSPSRRTFLLAGGAAAVVGAGIGVGLGVDRGDARAPAAPAPKPVRKELVDAIAQEVSLIAVIDAVSGASPTQLAVLKQLRADHAEHERVLRALIPAGSAALPTPTISMAPSSVAIVRSTESRASQVAASAAANAGGTTAVLLACIAACEATHAELLT